jgi:hypothetical protein
MEYFDFSQQQSVEPTYACSLFKFAFYRGKINQASKDLEAALKA